MAVARDSPAGIYCRISSDPTGERVGVDRQERDCRRLAEARGFRSFEVYVDNDTSAFSGVTRPAYRRLLDDLALRRLSAVIAWDPDRLHRSSLELEQFIELVDLVAVPVITVTAGRADLETPSGRLQVRMKGTIARYESEHKAERLTAAHKALAAAGRYPGGRPPYGYALNRDNVGRPLKDGTLRIVEDQAAVVREAVARALAGESPYRLCQAFNDRGIPTATGGGWRTSTMRGMLTNPTLAGLRSYRGDVVGPALWPGIISVEQHEALVARLTSRARRAEHPEGGRHRRSYLLTSGIAVCALCGTRLQSLRRAGGARAYRCTVGPDVGGCGRIAIQGPRLDSLVLQQVAHRVLREGALRLQVADALGQARRRIARAMLAGDLTADDLAVATGEPGPAGAMVAELVAAVIELPLEERRQFILTVVDHVTVRPTAVRGNFDPTRVSISWREGETGTSDERAVGPRHACVQLALAELSTPPEALPLEVDDRRIRELYVGGLTIDQTAEATRTSYGIVRRSLMRSGTPARPGGAPSKLDDGHVVELYQDGFSLNQIAGEFDVTAATIRNVLIRRGIPRRTRSRTNRR